MLYDNVYIMIFFQIYSYNNQSTWHVTIAPLLFAKGCAKEVKVQTDTTLKRINYMFISYWSKLYASYLQPHKESQGRIKSTCIQDNNIKIHFLTIDVCCSFHFYRIFDKQAQKTYKNHQKTEFLNDHLSRKKNVELRKMCTK